MKHSPLAESIRADTNRVVVGAVKRGGRCAKPIVTCPEISDELHHVMPHEDRS
jgi:hypothetical protein